MPSTYTLNNGITLIATGEQSGTWGATTNVNLGLVDTALDGQVTVTLASAGSSGSPNALAISDGAASNGRNRMVIFDDGGDLGATAYVQLTPNDSEKIIYVRNALSGSRSILLFQGTYNASNDYEVPAGTTAVVYFNGGGTGAVAANVFNNAYFDGLRLGSVSVTAILDEDNMSSDSATALATQQSIKAYVDSQVGTVDTLAEILANGNTTGGTDIVVSSGDVITTNTINETTAASGVTIDSLLVKDGGITAAGTSTFAGQTITNLGAVTTADINGGTIDGTVIGGASAAAGTFTTFTSTGIDDNASSTAVTITSSQNVGIGTSSPATKFHVLDGTSSLRFRQNGTVSETLVVGPSGGDAALYFGDTVDTVRGGLFYDTSESALQIRGYNNDTRMTFDSSGNVGIGTASPSSLLNIYINSLSDREALVLNSNGGVLNGASIDIQRSNVSMGKIDADYFEGMRFYVTDGAGAASTERMRIDAGGNVGIGTTDPAQELHVVGKTRIQRSSNANLEITSDNNTGVNPFLVGSNSDTFYIKNQAASGFGTGGDFIQYSESGSLRLMGTNYIDSSGNVGIGNAAPSYLLDLYKAAGTVARVRNSAATGGTPSITHSEFVIESTDANMGMEFLGSTTADQRILFSDTDTASGQIRYNHTSNYMALSTSTAEAMRITSSGNVGIGTSLPAQFVQISKAAGAGTTSLLVSNPAGTGGSSAALKLGVSPEDNSVAKFAIIHERLAAYGGGDTYFCSNYAANTTEVTDADAVITIKGSTGNVGIGTSSPAVLLHISSATPSIRLTDTDDNSDAQIGAAAGGLLVFDADINNEVAGSAMLFRVDGGSEKMRITSAGNVGIGIASPATKFHVLDGTSSLRFRQNGTVSETLVVGPSGGDAALYFGDTVDTVRGGLFYDTSENDLQIRGYNNSTRIIIDSSGNVGIGTLSPDFQLDVSGTTDPRIVLQSTGTASTDDTIFMNRVGGTTATNQIWFGDSGNAATGKLQYDHSNNAMTFHTNGGSEKMRITSAGDVGIAAASSVGSDSTGQGFWFNNSEAARFSRASNISLVLNRITTTGSIQSLRYNGAQVGSISVTASATAYNTSSDYRLKENVVNLSGAIDRVKLLKPSRFNFIADPDTTVDGFVAHEVSDIVPEAVHGEKDAVDADGNPEYQGIDQSKLVPVLTAALQEALTKIEALEARIVALETA